MYRNGTGPQSVLTRREVCSISFAMHTLRRTLLLLALAPLAACASGRGTSSAPVSANTVVPTQLIVHVPTHDAKLIGSAVGGVRITVRDVNEDRTLVTGLHEGTTGDTRRIMETPRARGDKLFTTSDGARFQATIPLSSATLVEVTAEGPLGYPDQMARTSKRLVMVPGRHLTGDGLVLEMHGYIIDLLAPDSALSVQANSRTTVRARVRMLCSCPTGPDEMWKVSDVRARLIRDGMVVRDVVMPYAGAASEYAVELPGVAAGQYTLEIIAASPDIATFGVLRREVVAR